jgi:hypothetical protein
VAARLIPLVGSSVGIRVRGCGHPELKLQLNRKKEKNTSLTRDEGFSGFIDDYLPDLLSWNPTNI